MDVKSIGNADVGVFVEDETERTVRGLPCRRRGAGLAGCGPLDEAGIRVDRHAGGRRIQRKRQHVSYVGIRGLHIIGVKPALGGLDDGVGRYHRRAVFRHSDCVALSVEKARQVRHPGRYRDDRRGVANPEDLRSDL